MGESENVRKKNISSVIALKCVLDEQVVVNRICFNEYMGILKALFYQFYFGETLT